MYLNHFWNCTTPRGDVLSIGLLGVNAPAAAKVCQLQAVVHDENILGLDVPVEDAVAVHMVHGSHQLIHVVADAVLCHIVPSAPDELIDVHVHELKHQGKPACGL
eukprot:scaffold8222_cov21-Tisochrysis_lutea.AAC.1